MEINENLRFTYDNIRIILKVLRKFRIFKFKCF